MKVVVNGPRREVCVESGVIIRVDVEGAESDIVNVSYMVVNPESDFEVVAVDVPVALAGKAIFSLLLLPRSFLRYPRK